MPLAPHSGHRAVVVEERGELAASAADVHEPSPPGHATNRRLGAGARRRRVRALRRGGAHDHCHRSLSRWERVEGGPERGRERRRVVESKGGDGRRILEVGRGRS